jgi:DNA-binding NtrC family response regulator
VRELKNIIERALIESGGGPIQAQHIRLFSSNNRAQKKPKAQTQNLPPLPLNLEAAEQELIQRAIHEANGNIAEAARLLGVNRSRIYRRISPDSPA